MKISKPWKSIGWGLMAVLLPLAAAQAANPKTQLKKYLAALSASPDNHELRVKIIRLSRKMKPKPALPAEAKDLLIQAKNDISQTQSPEGYQAAVDAYQKASLLAPWEGNIYYNLGVAQEKAGKLQEALDSYKLYLEAYPDAQDKLSVQRKIDRIPSTLAYARKLAPFIGVWECGDMDHFNGINVVNISISRNADGYPSVSFVDSPQCCPDSDFHARAGNFSIGYIVVVENTITFNATYIGPMKSVYDVEQNGTWSFSLLKYPNKETLSGLAIFHPVKDSPGYPDQKIEMTYHRIR